MRRLKTRKNVWELLQNEGSNGNGLNSFTELYNGEYQRWFDENSTWLLNHFSIIALVLMLNTLPGGCLRANHSVIFPPSLTECLGKYLQKCLCQLSLWKIITLCVFSHRPLSWSLEIYRFDSLREERGFKRKLRRATCSASIMISRNILKWLWWISKFKLIQIGCTVANYCSALRGLNFLNYSFLAHE